MDLAPAAARRPLRESSSKEVMVGGETYDVPTDQAIVVTDLIIRMWEKLGCPEDMFSESGQKLMAVIIATWEDTFPVESQRWYEERKLYQKEEKTTQEQVHQNTGRSLASYPYYIYSVMKIVFPKVKYSNRETVLKLVKHYPLFRFANKV